MKPPRRLGLKTLSVLSVCLRLALVIPYPLAAQSAASGRAGSLAGIWENRSRFVQFSDTEGMRIVLKPYYGFVYEDTGWIPAAVTGADGAASPDSATGGVSLISVRYSGEKTDAEVPAALLGDGLWFRFFSRLDRVPPAHSGSAGTDAAAADATNAANAALAARLSGFWRAAGATDAMRLYRGEPAEDFYTYYFAGDRYWRIRFWATDARKRDVLAHFPGSDGVDIPIPKFLEIAGALYTCVTGTGTLVRNYEAGSWSLADGKMTFAPDRIVYPGTAAEYRNPARVTVSADGAVLAFGEPWLTRSKITDLDAEITAHNGLRRPPREPLLEFMDLDFRWEDIERIRNHGMEP